MTTFAAGDATQREPSRKVKSGRARIDEAALSAFVVACGYIFLSSLVLVFLPDAGRGLPNNLLIASGVFAVTFVVVVTLGARSQGVSTAVAHEREVTTSTIGVIPLADAFPVGIGDDDRSIDSPRADRDPQSIPPRAR